MRSVLSQVLKKRVYEEVPQRRNNLKHNASSKSYTSIFKSLSTSKWQSPLSHMYPTIQCHMIQSTEPSQEIGNGLPRVVKIHREVFSDRYLWEFPYRHLFSAFRKRQTCHPISREWGEMWRATPPYLDPAT
jgi:hypothetical protein